MKEHLENARAFIQDTLDTQFPSPGAIGNLMAARDEIDKALHDLQLQLNQRD